MARDLAKTATFAMLHFGVGFGVTYAFTGSVQIATGVALVEPAVNTVVFFFHERVWQKLGARFGLRRRGPADTAVLGCGHAV
ncbi:MAG: DUF2061 domain-containing protein [Zavarzinia sp.]|nr:DUF2061 domain-containing protein [Zavarzinia sp.]